jgi:hypothetical protein
MSFKPEAMLDIQIDDDDMNGLEDQAGEIEKEYRSHRPLSGAAINVRPLSSDAHLHRVRSGDTRKTASLRKTESQQQFNEVEAKYMMNDSQDPSKITGIIPI